MNVQGPKEQRVAPDYRRGAGEGSGLSIADLMLIARSAKRLIVCFVFSGAALACGVAWVMPTMYTATALFVPPAKEPSLTNALMGQLGPLAAVAGTDLGFKNPADMYVGILESRTIADQVIAQYGLRELWSKKTATDTRAKLRSRAHFVSGKDSLIKVQVEDTDPRRAANMANTFVAELNRRNKLLTSADAGQRRQFLEQQVAAEEVKLSQAEDAMKAFQSSTGVVQLDLQASVAIKSVAELKAQIAASQIGLERLKMGATAQNPDVVRAEAEIQALKAQLSKLKQSPNEENQLDSTSQLPEAGREYVQRLRDLKYHEFLFELLSKQYEAAKLDEAKASPDIQVIDLAVPPDKKSGPPRAAITILGGVLGMIVALLLTTLKKSETRSSIAQADNAAKTAAQL